MQPRNPPSTLEGCWRKISPLRTKSSLLVLRRGFRQDAAHMHTRLGPKPQLCLDSSNHIHNVAPITLPRQWVFSSSFLFQFETLLPRGSSHFFITEHLSWLPIIDIVFILAMKQSRSTRRVSRIKMFRLVVVMIWSVWATGYVTTKKPGY